MIKYVTHVSFDDIEFGLTDRHVVWKVIKNAQPNFARAGTSGTSSVMSAFAAMSRSADLRTELRRLR
jgi:hypothetical protein